MKKNFCKLFALTMAALMMMSTMAFADAAIGGTADDNGLVTLPGENVTDAYVVTATLTGLQASEEATILVLKDGVTLSNDIANSDIVYIDQLTTDENGSVTFTFDASAVVPAEEPTENTQVYVDFYCGYTSMNANPLAGTALVYNYEVEEETYLYGDINNDTRINARDATELAKYIVGDLEELAVPESYADLYVDGRVNARDKTTLAQFIVGDIEELPVQK